MIKSEGFKKLQAQALGHQSMALFQLYNSNNVLIDNQYSELELSSSEDTIRNYRTLYFTVGAGVTIKEIRIRVFNVTTALDSGSSELLVTIPLPNTTTTVAGIYTINRIGIEIK